MINATFRLPRPRPSIDDPLLTRPDWTNGQGRPEGRLWLDKNENPDPRLHAVIREELRALDDAALFGYPDAAPTYRKLAAHLGIGAEQLLLTAGSDGAIRAVFETFISPGDQVLLTEPTFAMYPVYSRIYGASVHGLAYEPSPEGPVLCAQRVVDAIASLSPRLVCLPNPDSPTGTTFSSGEMRHIIEEAGRVGAVMLVDEAYYPFHPETVLSLIDEYPHLVVTRTFAKAWGLAGARIGFAAASRPLVELLHKQRPMYEAGTIGIALLDRMLDRYADVDASIKRLEEGKAWFLQRMRELGFHTLSSAGNFCHVAFGAKGAGVHAALADKVLYRKDFAEPCLRGYSRFSSATVEQFALVVRVIEAVVKG